MKDMTISARISEDLGRQLDSLAQATRRSRSWLIEEALRTYVAEEMQFLAAVEKGIRDMEAGNVIDHDEFVESLRQRRSGRTG